MDQLAAQWPIVAAMVVFAGALLKVIQSQYETIIAIYKEQIAKLEDDRNRYRDIAFSTTHIAEGAVGKLEEQRRLP